MKVLIAIESCEAHSDRVKAQFDTWVNFKRTALFDEMCGGNFNIIGFTGSDLGVPDDYEHLPEKTRELCKTTILNDIDYMLKVDTDTYVNVERLLASGFEKYYYSGYVLDWLDVHYCAGPAYWLSRKAMELVASADLSKYRHPSYPTAEDVSVGMILKEHGILPHHDHRYALHADVLPGNDIITSHLSTYHGAYKTEMMYQAHQRFLE